MGSERATDLVGVSTFPLSHLASGGKSGSLTPPKSLKRADQLLVKTGWWTCPYVWPGPFLGDGGHHVLFGEKPQEEGWGMCWVRFRVRFREPPPPSLSNPVNVERLLIARPEGLINHRGETEALSGAVHSPLQ